MSEDDSYDSNQSQDLKKVILSEICVEIFQLIEILPTYV